MKRLRYNSVIAITVVVFLLSLLVGVLVIARVREQLIRVATEDYKEQQTLLANQVAETLSNNLINVENQLKLMATMPEVQNIDDPERCNAKLNELLQVNQRQLGNLGRTDPNGIFVCSVNTSIIGQDSAQYGQYVHELIKDPNHRPVLGPLTKPVGANSNVTAVHVPVYQNGKFRGTIGGALYFNKFQDTYLESITFGKSGHVVVIDDNGDILYHPSPEQNGKNMLDPKVLQFFDPQATMRQLLKDIQVGKSGTFEYTLQGTEKTGLYKAFAVPGTQRHWGIVVTIPQEDIEHVINDAGINKILPVLFLLFIVTTGLLTFIGLRNIIKHMEVQQMKDDFISITSHQLRTPATIVKQNLGLIMGGFVTNKKDSDKFITSAYESNENQLSIIENILSVSKLEAGRLELQKETIIVQDLVQRTADTLRNGLAMRQQKLQVSMPRTPINIHADPTKLAMAIENLISNAVKYTAPKGKITIKVSKDNNNVFIAVKDNGKGITKEDIPQLFKRFNRLHSALISHVPGTGLGLYLTKKIVEMHGGTVTVASRIGQGSTFTITLPLH